MSKENNYKKTRKKARSHNKDELLFWGLAGFILLYGFILVGVTYAISPPILREEFFRFGPKPTIERADEITIDYVNFGIESTPREKTSLSETSDGYYDDDGHYVRTGTTSLESYADISFPQTRWLTNSASVFIDVDVNSPYYQIYLEAIDAWNNTGLFQLNQTYVGEHDIRLFVQYAGQEPSYAGLANSTYDLYTNQMYNVDVFLNLSIIEDPAYEYTREQILNVAIHEIGHALGLEHYDDAISVMMTEGADYGIQQIDIDHLYELYHG